MRGNDFRSLLRPGVLGTGLTALFGIAALAMPAGAQQVAITTDDMVSILPREIGPAVSGGRVHDVESIPSNPSLLYVATASGGIWRSENRGHTWTNLTDHLPVSTFGDIALAPSNPSIIYAGTGEQNNRQSTSWGNGVYRSDDGGDTWRHLGLDNTRHIGEVQIHPTNPQIAWVAALGNLWAPSEDRGVYRTMDGGQSWEKVLYVDEFTGAVDLVVDPQNPMNVYAGMYQRQRRAFGFNGGGPGSGLYKSTDGGTTWAEMTNGIPAGDKGRIGLAISASNPRVVMALVETADRNTQGTYRSEDGGATWNRMSGNNGRPMYYSHIYVDPTNDMRIYTMATNAAVSEDGGRTFTSVADDPTYDVGVHLDHHTMWINPSDPDHFYMAGDGGLHETYDRGLNFRKINNYVSSQAYAVGVDMRTPYRVYTGLQDNHSFAAPNENRRWAGIVNDDWQQVGFSDGMYWQPNWFDTTQAYGSSWAGNYFRTDTRTGDIIGITPQEGPGESFRWDFAAPMMASRHNPNVVYVGAQFLFRSANRGSSWTQTVDLSRGIDSDTMTIMGVAVGDITISANDGVSGFGTIVTLSESPLDPAILWVGLDDGNLQVSRDAGASWTEVSRNVSGVPNGTLVSRVAASHAAPGTAWAAFDGHRDGNFDPYIYRTTDFGQSWTAVHSGLPSGSVLSLAEHPDNTAVIFAGTEHGVFVSTNTGQSWARVPNTPTTAYDDLIIHPRDKDLVMGTHGRGIWVMDDTGPIAEWTQSVVASDAHLFSVPSREIFVYWKDTSYRGMAEYAGVNPPNGVEITYRLGAGSGPATLRVHNEDGQLVRTIQVPSTPGTHRVNWDLKWGFDQDENWERWEDPLLKRPISGGGDFWVAPGRFRITLDARGATSSQGMLVLADPISDLTQADYDSREAFMLGVRELLTQIEERMEGASGDDVQRYRGMMRTLQGAAFGMDGGQARQGTLHPPTQQTRDAVAAVRAMLAGM